MILIIMYIDCVAVHVSYIIIIYIYIYIYIDIDIYIYEYVLCYLCNLFSILDLKL